MAADAPPRCRICRGSDSELVRDGAGAEDFYLAVDRATSHARAAEGLVRGIPPSTLLSGPARGPGADLDRALTHSARAVELLEIAGRARKEPMSLGSARALLHSTAHELESARLSFGFAARGANFSAAPLTVTLRAAAEEGERQAQASFREIDRADEVATRGRRAPPEELLAQLENALGQQPDFEPVERQG